MLLMKDDLKNSLTLMTMMFDFMSQLDEGQLSDLLTGKVSLQLKTSEDDRFEALFREELKKPEMVALMDERIKVLMGGQVADVAIASKPSKTTNKKPDPKQTIPKKDNSDKSKTKPSTAKTTTSNTITSKTAAPPLAEKRKGYRKYTAEDRDFILNPDTPIEAIMERYGIDKKHSVYGVKAHLRKQLEREAQGQGGDS